MNLRLSLFISHIFLNAFHIFISPPLFPEIILFNYEHTDIVVNLSLSHKILNKIPLAIIDIYIYLFEKQ